MNHAYFLRQPAKFLIRTLALGAVMGASAVGQQSNPHPATLTEPSSKGIIRANNTPSNTAGTKSSYVIGPGDLLAINVLHEPEVSQKVPVRMDGKITMPLIGEIQASGMMPDNLQATIAQKLHDYIKDAEVTVVVEEIKSRQFIVMGEVEHPGSFPLVRPTTVLDGLALAGGFRDFAKVSKIRVLRKTPQGTTVTFPFNYKQVSKGQNDSQNIELRPGDTIIVP